jgi:hypothetical protein
MNEIDPAFLDKRATAEFQLAQQASSMEQARPHYRKAINYLNRAEMLKRRLRYR